MVDHALKIMNPSQSVQPLPTKSFGGARAALASYGLGKTFTLEQVRTHNNDEDGHWIVIHDKIYDCTEYLPDHPGGAAWITEWSGTDVTLQFLGENGEKHEHSKNAKRFLRRLCVGSLHADDVRYPPPKEVKKKKRAKSKSLYFEYDASSNGKASLENKEDVDQKENLDVPPAGSVDSDPYINVAASSFHPPTKSFHDPFANEEDVCDVDVVTPYSPVSTETSYRSWLYAKQRTESSEIYDDLAEKILLATRLFPKLCGMLTVIRGHKAEETGFYCLSGGWLRRVSNSSASPSSYTYSKDDVLDSRLILSPSEPITMIDMGNTVTFECCGWVLSCDEGAKLLLADWLTAINVSANVFQSQVYFEAKRCMTTTVNAMASQLTTHSSHSDGNSHKSCVFAIQVIEWIEDLFCFTEALAIELANAFVDARLLRHVGNRHMFCSSGLDLIFQFTKKVELSDEDNDITPIEEEELMEEIRYKIRERQMGVFHDTYTEECIADSNAVHNTPLNQLASPSLANEIEAPISQINAMESIHRSSTESCTESVRRSSTESTEHRPGSRGSIYYDVIQSIEDFSESSERSIGSIRRGSIGSIRRGSIESVRRSSIESSESRQRRPRRRNSINYDSICKQDDVMQSIEDFSETSQRQLEVNNTPAASPKMVKKRGSLDLFKERRSKMKEFDMHHMTKKSTEDTPRKEQVCHEYPCYYSPGQKPQDPAVWPQKPLLLRPSPGSGMKIVGIRHSSSKRLFLPGSGFCCGCSLPINTGNEQPGKCIVIDFETDSFVGTLLLRIQGVKDAQMGTVSLKEDDHTLKYFDYQPQKTFQVVVKGRFKKETPMEECITGQCFDRPSGNLLPMWIIRSGINMISLLSPNLQYDFNSQSPTFFSPLVSTAQSIVSKEPKEGEINDESMEHNIDEPWDSTSILVETGFQPLTRPECPSTLRKTRKSFFDLQHPQPNFRTDREYTFEFYQNLLHFDDFSIQLGSVGRYQLKDMLNGQPLKIMAARRQGNKLDCLWSFDLWHDSLYDAA